MKATRCCFLIDGRRRKLRGNRVILIEDDTIKETEIPYGARALTDAHREA